MVAIFIQKFLLKSDPFGMEMPGRTYSTNQYRYGFQGQEKDDEVKGSGSSLNFKYRIYDSRIGRFFAVDPLFAEFAWQSPYVFSENRVVDGIEWEGLERIDNDVQNVDGVVVQVTFTKSNNSNPKTAALGAVNYSTMTNHTLNNNGQVVNSSVPTQTNGVGGASIVKQDIRANGGADEINALNGTTSPPNNKVGIETNSWVKTVNNQFDQGYVIINQDAFGNAVNAPGAFGQTANNDLNNGTPFTGTLTGNVTKMILITDGTVAANQNAIAQMAIIQAANPNIEIAIATQSNFAAINNGTIGIIYNPTQTYVNNNNIGGFIQPFAGGVNGLTPTVPVLPLVNQNNQLIQN